MSSIKGRKLKIKTSFNDDLRLLKVIYEETSEVYERIKGFILSSYPSIKNLNKYMLQYRDDENDLVTIATKDDLEDAIQQAFEEKKSLKIFVTKKKIRPVTPQKEEKVKAKKKEEKIDETVENNNNNNNNKNDKEESTKITGNVCNDIVNNIPFRKEVISFLSTVVLIYQENKGAGDDNQLDLKSCIATALSTHPKVSNHTQIKEKILPQLDVYIANIEPIAKQFLYSFDASKIAEMVNNVCESKKKGNCAGMMNMCGPLSFLIGNLMNGAFYPQQQQQQQQQPQNFFQQMQEIQQLYQQQQGVNCPKQHGLKEFYTQHGSYCCDVCNRSIQKGEKTFGCRICDWDCCLTCKEGQTPGIPRQPFMPPPPMFPPQPHQHQQQPFGPGFGHGFAHWGRGGRRRHHPHWGHHGHHGRGHRHGHQHHGHRHRHGHGQGQGQGYHSWGRGYKCGGTQYDNNNNNNNNNNIKDNNNNSEALEYRADIIENPLPLISQSVVNADERITKKWKLKNVGSTNLPGGLLVKYCGRKNNPMITTNQFTVGNMQEIKSGEEFVVRVSILTPNAYGSYSSNWRLTTPNGKKFGQKLPFNLVLEAPNQNQVQNNGNSDNDSIKELAEEIVAQVKNEKEQQQQNDNDNIDDVEVEILAENEEEEEDEEEGVDMVLNDSDDDDDDESVEPKEIEKKENINLPVENEPEEEAYQYQQQLDKLQQMGFNNDQFLKELLDCNKGQLNQVVALLLK